MNKHIFPIISLVCVIIIIILLIYTASQGTLIEGANASRWIRLPVIGLSFQTSTLASLITMIYTSYYFSKYNSL